MPTPLTLLPPPVWHWVGPRVAWPRNQFFLSFEDALWSIVRHYELEGKSALYPSFFCMDVVARLEARGLTCTPYFLDKDLEIQEESFFHLLKSYRPHLLFLYHPLGKRLSPHLVERAVRESLPECIVIEDCADLLLCPKEILFYSEHHLVIDSLRKVTCYQGSRVFSQSPLGLKGRVFSDYHWLSLLYYLIYRAFGVLGQTFSSRTLLNSCWKWFGIHSDCIGSAQHPAFGFVWDNVLSSFLPVVRVQEKKKSLAEAYALGFAHEPALAKHLVVINPAQFSSLRFWPLCFQKGIGQRVAQGLERRSIEADTHFDDAPHCVDKEYLLLPLCHTMSEGDVRRICAAVVSEIHRV